MNPWYPWNNYATMPNFCCPPFYNQYAVPPPPIPSVINPQESIVSNQATEVVKSNELEVLATTVGSGLHGIRKKQRQSRTKQTPVKTANATTGPIAANVTMGEFAVHANRKRQHQTWNRNGKSSLSGDTSKSCSCGNTMRQNHRDRQQHQSTDKRHRRKSNPKISEKRVRECAQTEKNNLKRLERFQNRSRIGFGSNYKTNDQPSNQSNNEAERQRQQLVVATMAIALALQVTPSAPDNIELD